VLQKRLCVSEAAAELRRAYELGNKQKDWAGVSAWQLANAEREAALAPRLPGLLSGEDQPSDPVEQATLAGLYRRYMKLNVAAARYYANAFAAEPKPTEELLAYRYSAACAAALAGSGQGKDAAKLDGAARARLRRQALEWLTAELAAQAKLADNPADRPRLRRNVQHWQRDTDFAGVRGDAALPAWPCRAAPSTSAAPPTAARPFRTVPVPTRLERVVPGTS
jgi:hypothetical protein